MLIGNGDIAKVLKNRDGALMFASGVSNSNCNDDSEFERERYLLFLNKNKYRGLCCFYFSSISVFDRMSPYLLHKLEMEDCVKRWFEDYNIIRIGNIDWGTNPNTFINFIRNKIAKGEEVEIKDEYRYVITKEQLRLLTDNLPLNGKNEICAFGNKAKVRDLI